MKDTFTDSDSAQQIERRTDRLFKKSGALATLALAGASLLQSNTAEVDVHAVPAPGHVLRDSNGDVIPTIPAERTVTLPSVGGQAESFYPNYVERPGTCQVIDLRLPQRIDYGEVVKGSKTEFALPTEQYQQLRQEASQAESLPALQKVLTEATTELGIQAKFDVPLSSNYLPYAKGATDPDMLNGYQHGVTTLLNALSLMPRQMATTEAESVNFVNVQYFTRKDGFRAGGLWSVNKKEITLPMLGLTDHNVVHEFAHAMHTKACDGASDKELEDEFNTIMQYLHSEPRLKYLEDKFWQKKRTDNDAMQHLEYIKQGKLSGLPTEYSRSNYVELLAEMTASMVCEDGLLGDTASRAEEQESARVVREMVLERLQKAMPDVNVNAWMEYIRQYTQTQPSVLDPEHAIKDHVSPYDGTYAYYNYVYGHDGELKADWKLTPAIAIKGQSGAPDQYIYAYQNLKSGEVDIQIAAPEGAGDVKDLLIQAGTRYIRSLPGYENKKIQMLDAEPMTGRSDNAVELVVFGR